MADFQRIKDIVSEVKKCGCQIVNIMQLIPLKESNFEHMELVSNMEFNRIRKECGELLPQMYHCRQCRADAVGTLNHDLSSKYSRCGVKDA
jgi:MoaA/NifB/PqqE/SkfB family radical SAM enzyme